MGLSDDLTSTVRTIFGSNWTVREMETVPESKDVGLLGNDGVKLDAAILYADLAESTTLVRSRSRQFAGEIYKTFLHCAARIIEAEGGTVTAYDGDRVMAVFIKVRRHTRAARAALKINYAVREIINPALARQYPSETYRTKHFIGIDRSEVLVARTGVRGANDLVWVGRAANYAAKLASVRGSYSTLITEDTYKELADDGKYSTKDGVKVDMWKALTWNTFDNSRIYGSTWQWTV